MRPDAGQVLHFSEDPTITVFAPHVARTSRQAAAYVWAVDAERAPAYWFPRQCPRAMAWTTPRTTTADAAHIIGPGAGSRVHAVEYAWLDRIRSVELFAYRLPAEPFTPLGEPEPHAHVATATVPAARAAGTGRRPARAARGGRDRAAGAAPDRRLLGGRRGEHARVQRDPAGQRAGLTPTVRRCSSPGKR